MESIKRTNSKTIKRKEKKLRSKGQKICLTKSKKENFPILNKEVNINVQEACKISSRSRKKFLFIRDYQSNDAQNKEWILKAVKNKDQVTYKGRSIRITLNF